MFVHDFKQKNLIAGRARQRGQGMTEYIIIVALVAVAAIAVYQYFGQVLRAQTAAMAKEIAGEDGTQQSRSAQHAAESAAGQAIAKSLKSFTGNNEGGSPQ
jgi:Flp pilus assembly pilin Flp